MKKALFVCLSIVAFALGAHAQIAKPLAEDAKSPEKTIKNAPFSADAVTESVQILWDGTKITRRTSSKLYRDNEGRFRREDSKTLLGVPGERVEIAESIRITDPVAGLKFNLDVKDRIFKQSSFGQKKDFKFEQMQVKQKEWSIKQQGNIEKQYEKIAEQAERRAEQQSAENSAQAEINRKRAGDGRVKDERGQGAIFIKPPDVKIAETAPHSSDKNAKVESLGVQTVEGIAAEGTRTTTTIPAGAIGNDRDINIVYEKWYSKELQLTVLSKHNDPRFGEQTYRLLNISRDNPPISLFQPPADYRNDDDKDRIKEPRGPAKPGAPNIKINPPAPPKPGSEGKEPVKPIV
jgi:hypothetical protein